MYDTKEKDIPNLIRIIDKMHATDLDPDFVSRAFVKAKSYEGLYDLLVIWDEEEDSAEKKLALNDIVEMVDEVTYWDNKGDKNV